MERSDVQFSVVCVTADSCFPAPLSAAVAAEGTQAQAASIPIYSGRRHAWTSDRPRATTLPAAGQRAWAGPVRQSPSLCSQGQGQSTIGRDLTNPILKPWVWNKCEKPMRGACRKVPTSPTSGAGRRVSRA